jgi:anti-sigma factor RsiW
MKCDNAIDLIVDSLMDSLEEEQQKLLEEHLQSCESCAAEARKMNELWAGLGDLNLSRAAPQAPVEAAPASRCTAPSGRRGRHPLLARQHSRLSGPRRGGAIGCTVGRTNHLSLSRSRRGATGRSGIGCGAGVPGLGSLSRQ